METDMFRPDYMGRALSTNFVIRQIIPRLITSQSVCYCVHLLPQHMYLTEQWQRMLVTTKVPKTLFLAAVESDAAYGDSRTGRWSKDVNFTEIRDQRLPMCPLAISSRHQTRSRRSATLRRKTASI